MADPLTRSRAIQDWKHDNPPPDPGRFFSVRLSLWRLILLGTRWLCNLCVLVSALAVFTGGALLVQHIYDFIVEGFWLSDSVWVTLKEWFPMNSVFAWYHRLPQGSLVEREVFAVLSFLPMYLFLLITGSVLGLILIYTRKEILALESKVLNEIQYGRSR